MNLANKVREFGSNLGHNLKQHGVKYILITTMTAGGAMAVSGCNEYSQEEVNKMLLEQQQRDQYIDTQVAKIPGIEEQVGKNAQGIEDLNTKIDTKIGEVNTNIVNQTTILQQSIEDALTQYSQEQTQKDTVLIYRPGDGRRYDGPQYENDRRVNELIRATRYSFPKNLVEDMREWNQSGFREAFPFVKSWWLDGRTSNGEVQSGTALHVDEPNGKSRAYLRDGSTPTSTISVWKVENFLRDYFGSHIYDLSRVTIHNPGR